MRTFNLTCEAVETMLHEYLDETLEPWVRTSIEEHLEECEHCSDLARELRNIVREGAALPALLPERDVWPGIAGRIGVPVIDAEPVAESEPPPAATERVVWASDAFPPISEAAEVAIEPPTAASESPVLPLEPHVVMSDTPVVTSEPHVMMGDTAEVTSEPHVMTSDTAEVTSDPHVMMSDIEVTSESPIVISEPPPVEISEPPVVINEPLVASEPALTTEPPPVYRELSPPTTAPLRLLTEPLPPSGTAQAPRIGPTHPIAARREKFWTRERIGLAAAALVLLTAGATFLLTSHWLGPARTQNVATDTGAQKLSSNQISATASGARGRVAGRGQVASDSSILLPPPDQLGSALTVSAASATPVTPSPEQVVYTKEINTLQRIVRRQKGELDTSTVTEIDKNLRTLDSAIGQIRAALKKDPGSSLLDGQASHALEMKVELLRRAAMMRSST
jgi:anti-sigma factor RsiW